MKLNFCTVAVCLLLAGGDASAKTAASMATDTQIKTAIMDTIEQTATLPQGAAKLDQYDRSYTYMGDRSVIGIYVRTDLRGTAHTGERQWVSQKQMPQIAGGGCSVVTVFYDPKTHKADSMCNFAQ